MDAETGLTHTLATAATNEPDVTQACRLLHGGESQVCGDSGYQWARWGTLTTTRCPTASSRRASASCWSVTGFGIRIRRGGPSSTSLRGFYNRRRRHLALGYESPDRYKQQAA